jgi:hypothetical protein
MEMALDRFTVYKVSVVLREYEQNLDGTDTMSKIRDELEQVGMMLSNWTISIDRGIEAMYAFGREPMFARPAVYELTMEIRDMGSSIDPFVTIGSPERPVDRLTHSDIVDAISMLQNTSFFPANANNVMILHPDQAEAMMRDISQTKEKPKVESLEPETNSEELTQFFEKKKR